MRIMQDRPGPGQSEKLPIYRAADSSQKQAPRKGGDGDGGGAEGGGAKKMAKKGKDLKEEMDNLVDEIDMDAPKIRLVTAHQICDLHPGITGPSLRTMIFRKHENGEYRLNGKLHRI